jgi:hypothetical protein
MATTVCQRVADSDVTAVPASIVASTPSCCQRASLWQHSVAVATFCRCGNSCFRRCSVVCCPSFIAHRLLLRRLLQRTAVASIVANTPSCCQRASLWQHSVAVATVVSAVAPSFVARRLLPRRLLQRTAVAGSFVASTPSCCQRASLGQHSVAVTPTRAVATMRRKRNGKSNSSKEWVRDTVR